MVNRILRDDPSKGDMHNREGLNLKLFWEALKDYDLWPLYAIGILFSMAPGPASNYLTISLRHAPMNYDVFTTNLLTIPSSALFIIGLLTITHLSEKFNMRLVWGIFTQLWCLGPLIALAVLPADANRWGKYVAMTILIGYPYPHAIQVALTSRNAGSVRTRTVGSAIYNMFVQAGTIIYSNIYRADDAPLYRRGNRVLIAIVCLTIAVYVGTIFWYMWRNKKREEIWSKMTTEEKKKYLSTTKDEGNKRLDFRFSY